MRAPVIAAVLVLALAAPASAAVPLLLAERQVVVLEFQRPVTKVVTTDPDLLHVQLLAAGARVSIGALRGGRATLELGFSDGVTATYEVTVDGARRPVAAVAGPGELVLRVAEQRRVEARGVARVMVEENGVARVTVLGDAVTVLGLSPGDATLVLVDAAGAKTTWQIRVR